MIAELAQARSAHAHRGLTVIGSPRHVQMVAAGQGDLPWIGSRPKSSHRARVSAASLPWAAFPFLCVLARRWRCWARRTRASRRIGIPRIGSLGIRYLNLQRYSQPERSTANRAHDPPAAKPGGRTGKPRTLVDLLQLPGQCWLSRASAVRRATPRGAPAFGGRSVGADERMEHASQAEISFL